MTQDVNNHIHTTYSFSPYTPEQAVVKAKEAGLATAGIMDHDSIAGAREFIAAGREHGMPVTIGLECRANFDDTKFRGMRLNNPDQEGIAYVALHGVPHSRIDAVTEYMAPYREARERRNRLMAARLAELVAPAGLRLDYGADVLPLSNFSKGGSVTERHILYALALQIAKKPSPANFLESGLGLRLSDKQMDMLEDPANPYLDYDILGILKASLVEKFYLPATDECPPVKELAAFCAGSGIVFAYAYLGDVTDSVTGDKKAQRFEDSFLDELIEELPALGFNAVTYMPSRNTPEQMARLQALCEKRGLFQISGEDINQPRQRFVCERLRLPQFEHLAAAAWALIGHELRATERLEDGMFSLETAAREPDLGKRTREYAEWARAQYKDKG